jgi:hypothetical protein
MKAHLGTEQGVHGSRWHSLHNGYFSSPEIARPLVAAAAAALRPGDVVGALGGGPGFLLSQLAAACPRRAAAWRNLDCSDAQLAQTRGEEIVPVHATLHDFRRADVVQDHQRLFLLMRSVLHYAGRDGLPPLLRHLRAQARPGERFIHQSACFRVADDAACLNALYRLMRTDKWYPTVAELTRELQQAGWQTEEATPAPALLLHHEDLALRYHLSDADRAGIRAQLTPPRAGERPVFRTTADGGFEADLHYHIFPCVAV